MKWMRIMALAWLGGLCMGMTVHAQTTNAAATEIESLENQTNVIIVKGYGQGGMVSIGSGILTVRLKESYALQSGAKLQAVVLDFAVGGEHQRAVVDYSEIDSLLGALDYVRTATYDVTGLPGFQIVYRTKDGFVVIGEGSHRQSSVQTFVQFDGCERILLDSDQMAQLRNTIAQAESMLNDLKTRK